MHDKGNQCARPKCKKTTYEKVQDKKQDKSARLAIGFKGASQRCKSKVQDIGFDKHSRHKFKTLDSTKVQDNGVLHIRYIEENAHDRLQDI